jgi:hypothetical protein
VKTAIAAGCRLHDLLDHFVAGELVLLDGQVNAHDVLPDDAAGADVEVADLRVSHQALRETDGEGGSLELGVAGRALGEGVHDGGRSGGDGVAILGRVLGGDTPAVNHD